MFKDCHIHNQSNGIFLIENPEGICFVVNNNGTILAGPSCYLEDLFSDFDYLATEGN